MSEGVWSDGVFCSLCAISEENDVSRDYFVVLLMLRLLIKRLHEAAQVCSSMNGRPFGAALLCISGLSCTSAIPVLSLAALQDMFYLAGIVSRVRLCNN
jgi:hypothetical protein